MGSLNCFCPAWTKKKDKGGKNSVKLIGKEKKSKRLEVKLEHLQTSSDDTELKTTSFMVPVPFRISGSSRCKVKVMNHDSPVAANSGEVDYEGGDEQDETLSMRRDSEFNFQPCFENSNEEGSPRIQAIHSSSCKQEDTLSMKRDSEFNFQRCFENSHEEESPRIRAIHSSSSLYVDDDIHNSNTESMSEMKASGHVSDPGTREAEFWASPRLKRSCSNLSMRSMYAELHLLPPSKCKSYEELQKLSEMYREDVLVGDAISPISFRSHLSADKVILKKHSSSQILPSRSRKLWWKLFLWSHRNLHRTATEKSLQIEVKPSTINKHGIGGYSSDTVEPTSRKLTSPGSLTGESTDRGKCDIANHSWNGFHGTSGMWPQNQWVAFPTDSSPLARVNEWVKEVSSQPLDPVDDDDHHSEDDEIHFPPSPENVESPVKASSHLARNDASNLLEDISHANTVIRSLNANSNVAHITGLGLKAIPSISHFISLRSVNLSANLIVHITPGSLPKGLHILNLSRNKISTIEGLRDLTRLRVLDLSYNRISRIGQGLSNCTLVKELYLAGNKISTVEGLHRLLKLTVLDLSFNKITTAKALGQLVANYNSLIAVNLLGNPIQSNISDDLLRKTLCSLLPKLALLNKQPINPQKARELRVDANVKAALGNSSWNSRRKVVKKAAAQGSSSSHSVRRSSVSTGQKAKQRSRSHSHHRPKDKA